ncbi:hypothetical protein MVEN_00967400 [Mycena venus]|uniref:Uncharacterized protein n=1 Tax=Mycena venus TaxID=2733690 RepID=A0A8H7D271_9AGAR|nr:hypothetical protein MVEN_00967400 [Mycena venus]
MPIIPDEPLEILASTVPASTTTGEIVIMILAVIFVAGLEYYASPLRLTHVLVAAIAATEKAYLEALEIGLISPSDVETAEMLSTLQLKVLKIREASLRNSRSYWKAFFGFLEGRTLTVQFCIWKVRDLNTHIEILKEEKLRKRNFNPKAVVVQSLRRRREYNDII